MEPFSPTGRRWVCTHQAGAAPHCACRGHLANSPGLTGQCPLRSRVQPVCVCTMPQGSGKTHTLLGDVSCARERGKVPRAVAELARGIAEYPDRCQFKVDGCSVFTSPEHPS